MEEIKKKPPIPKGSHWLLGNIPGLMKDTLGYLTEIQKKYGNVIYLTAPVAAGRTIVVYDAEFINHVFIKNNRNYAKGVFIENLKPLIGEGLITSEGEFWKKQRRLIQPVFHKESMQRIYDSMQECINQLIGEWSEDYEDGDKLDLSAECNKLALRIVAKALFKVDLDDKISEISDNISLVAIRLMDRFRNPVGNASWLPLPANFKEKASISDLQKVVDDMIIGKKAGSIPQKGDILDMLLAVEDADTGEKMSDKQIRDELLTIMLAGHETTAQAMSFMFYLLSEHQEVLDKLKMECENLSDEPTYEEIRNAEYANCIVKESMRLYPPALILQRKALEQDSFGEFDVPANMNVLIPVYVIHRMEAYWENPEKFLPERFYADNMKDKPKFAYFPFGGGQRMCIGDQFAMIEMVLALVRIVKRFDLRNDSNCVPEIELAQAIRPKENIELHLYKN